MRHVRLASLFTVGAWVFQQWVSGAPRLGLGWFLMWGAPVQPKHRLVYRLFLWSRNLEPKRAIPWVTMVTEA